MGEGSRTNEDGAAAEPRGEDAMLDAAMSQLDERLVQSLRQEELRQRRRRMLFIGAGAMTFSTAVIIGSLILTGPATRPVLDKLPGKSATTQVSISDAKQAAGLVSEGWQLFNTQRFAEAESKFAQATAMDPGQAVAWSGLGLARLNGGDSEGAGEAFRRCLNLEPNYPGALNGMGYLRFNQRDYQGAENYWLAAIKAGATDPYLGLANAYLLTGNFENAVTWAEKAQKQQAGNPLVKRILEAARTGRLDPELRQMIEPPDNGLSDALSLLGRGAPDRARDLFERALKKNPQDRAAQTGMGYALLHTGDLARARTYFEAVIKAEPKNLGAVNGLVQCLKAEGKLEEAIALLKQMEKEPLQANSGKFGLAMTYLEQGRYAEAMPYWEELAQAEPQNPEIQRGLEATRARLAAKKF